MKQEMLEVYRDGKLWFEFPIENEMNVRSMLMQQKIDVHCEIKKKNLKVEVIQEKVKTKDQIIDLTEKQKKIKKEEL